MKLIGKIKRKIWGIIFNNARLSYSQSGEDMILDSIFCTTEKGVYVDIGANNPYVQSNTHYFYKKGWRGVNIDALPGSMKIFKKARSKDVNIEAAVSDSNSELTYYMFSSSFYNSFNLNNLEEIRKHTKLIGEKTIKTIKLSELFETLKLINIDFMSVDVEGLDYEVLISNDWGKYRPKVVVIEYITYFETELDHNTNVRNFLESVGYYLLCNSLTNAFFIEKGFFKERFKTT